MPTKTKVIQVPVSQALLDKLEEWSREREQSRAALIREACEEFLKALQEERWDREYAEGYEKFPEGAEEEAWAQVGVDRLSELLAEDSW